MTLRFQKLTPEAVLPVRAKKDDAGYDLSTVVDFALQPNERKVIPTGISMSLPSGYVGMVCPRSGLAAQYGIMVVNAPGIIDAGYRGEIKVILFNSGYESKNFKQNDRIAQLVIMKLGDLPVEEVNSLDSTERGTGGFGSTGV